MAEHARALSYHDIVLRRSDVDLLRGPYWLNDQIIAFYFEYLLHELHPKLSHTVALMPGASSYLLLNSDPADAAIIFEALQLHNKQLVVFAVNDNPDVEMVAGGAHWSCLAYHRPSNSFRHYDSCTPHNRSVARSLAGAAAPLVRSRDAIAAAAAGLKFPEYVDVAAMPQQQNSNDCGVYVLAVAHMLCDSLAQVHAAAGTHSTTAWQLHEEEESKLLKEITPSAVRDMRGQVLDVITSLAAGAASAAAAVTEGE